MPNNIVNIVRVNGSDERITSFFDSIKGDNEVIDFNRIIEMPEGLKDAKYCEWASENWGTKRNAYNSKKVDSYTIRFETAWNGVPELIGVVSEKWPELVFDYMFADEDYSYNTGIGWVQNGELNMYYPEGDSEDGWDIYFQTHEGMREQFEFKNGTYELI